MRWSDGVQFLDTLFLVKTQSCNRLGAENLQLVLPKGGADLVRDGH